MKHLLCCLLLLCVLFVGCEAAAGPAESSTQAPSEAPQTLPAASGELEIPQDLPGVWVSADAGKLMLSLRPLPSARTDLSRSAAPIRAATPAPSTAPTG